MWRHHTTLKAAYIPSGKAGKELMLTGHKQTLAHNQIVSILARVSVWVQTT